MLGRKAKKGEKQTEVDLNRVVTPMLDMTFQILFFLIMNFRLPALEGQVDLTLPALDTNANPVTTTIDDNTDKQDEFRLILIAGDSDQKKGPLAGITWVRKIGKLEAAKEGDEPADRPKDKQRKDEVREDIVPETAPDDEDDYARHLNTQLLYGLYKKLRLTKEKISQPKVTIESDGRLEYSELLRVMDIARKLKITNINVSLTVQPKKQANTE